MESKSSAPDRARPTRSVAGVLRNGGHAGLAALVLVFGCESLQTAAANGDTRAITFHHLHTKESLTVTYKRDGRYDPDALKKIDWVMRDWRRDETVRMDPKVIDAAWELYRAVDGRDGIDIICGYRAPNTNAMLRQRSSGVAEHSLHTRGLAIDLKVRNVSLDRQREAALRLHRGGVGYYPGSQFIHVDTGTVRHWPRMTYDQLVRVFPNGRTVHVPSNGKPLPGYQQALADLGSRGQAPSQTSLVAARSSGIDTASAADGSDANVFASFFGMFKGREGEERAAAAPAPARRAAATKADTRKPNAINPAATNLAAAKPEPRETAAPVKPVRTAAVPAPALTRVAQDPSAQAAAALAPARTPVRLASADGPSVPFVDDPPRPRAGMTRTLAADTDRTSAIDRVPSDVALSYAAEPDFKATFAALHTSALDVSTSITAEKPLAAAKKPSTRTAAARDANAPGLVARTVPVAAAPGMRFDDPWLRAVMLTPSLSTAMTVSMSGDPDFTEVFGQSRKPAGAVVTTFAQDPYPGVAPDRFAGAAVVFVPTVTFRKVAALR